MDCVLVANQIVRLNKQAKIKLNCVCSTFCQKLTFKAKVENRTGTLITAFGAAAKMALRFIINASVYVCVCSAAQRESRMDALSLSLSALGVS